RFRRHNFGESAAESLKFLYPPEPWLAHRFPALPISNGSLRESSEAGEEFATEPKSPTHRADRQMLGAPECVLWHRDRLRTSLLLLGRHTNLRPYYSRDLPPCQRICMQICITSSRDAAIPPC